MIIGYTIDDLGEAAAEQTFSWKINNDESVESVVTVENYYKERYGIQINDVIKKIFSRGHRYMYVGVDLSHIVSGPKKYSTVAVVASADDIPNRYFKEIYVQERLSEERSQSREYVVDMKAIMKSLISQYDQHHGYSPKWIVIYRDGVSDSEFDTVFYNELKGIREACVELSRVYRPYLTYIVVNKRHHTRIFPDDLNSNVPAGTVVDSHVITNPTTYDFFLNSHHENKVNKII
ncbi:unnamed protein product [Rotaria sp. Silwood2]|nr:unnamed protein product [Rotaria sp. Silwood2]CAF3989425.1 unnamed protein product [Rotaria sp. Silwood2]